MPYYRYIELYNPAVSLLPVEVTAYGDSVTVSGNGTLNIYRPRFPFTADDIINKITRSMERRGYYVNYQEYKPHRLKTPQEEATK